MSYRCACTGLVVIETLMWLMMSDDLCYCWMICIIIPVQMTHKIEIQPLYIFVDTCTYVSYIHHCTHTQVYAQIEELQTQLEKSKRNESLLQEEICKAELKFSILQDYCNKLSGEEHMETQLKIKESKQHDVKSEFSGTDEVKMAWTEQVCS